MSPPIHSSASGRAPPSLVSQSRAGFVAPAAPGKVVAGAALGGWSRGTEEGKAPGPGSAGAAGGAAASEGDGWEATRSVGVAVGSTSVRAGTVVPGPSRGLGGRGPSCRGDAVEAEAEAGVGLGSAHGPPVLSGEGRVPGGVSEAAAEEGTPGSAGRVSGAGVTVVLGAAGGEGPGASFAGGAGESSGLWGEAEEGRRAPQQAAGRKGCVRRRGDRGKEKQTQPINSPEGGAGSGVCAEGARPRPRCLSAANALLGGGPPSLTDTDPGPSEPRLPGHPTPAWPGRSRAHLLAGHHGPGVTRGPVRTQVLPDAPVTPPAAAHTGLAPAQTQPWGTGHGARGTGQPGLGPGEGLTVQTGGGQ